jgi:glycosyltransferase involved in cell wall biosynthesis
VKLVLLGGARNAEDRARVQSLKDLAEQLKITPHVEFIINASYPEMLGWLAKASIGLSTMVDEHFGINVVEFMAGPLSYTIRCVTYRIEIGSRRDSCDACFWWSTP